MHCVSRYLYGFEMYERAKEEGKPLVVKGTRRQVPVQENDEDLELKQARLQIERVEQETISSVNQRADWRPEHTMD